MAAKSDGAAAVAGPGPEEVAGGARGGAGGRGEAAAVAGGAEVTGAGGPGPRYELRDCCWVLCALLVFFSDGATDLWLAASYYIQGQRTYFGLTLLFVFLPSLVVQLLSFRWFVYDYTEPAGAPGPAVSTKDSSACGPVISTKDSAVALRTKEGSPEVGPRPAPSSARAYRRRCCRLCVWLLQTLVHLLQLGQVWRYLHTLYLGLQSRWRGEPLQRHFYWRMLFESADVSMLRLLETFLRSAPQLVLQLSLIVHRSDGDSESYSNRFQQLPVFSTFASLLSLAWTLASYQKVLRDSRDDKRPLSYKGAVVQVLWHLFTIAARSLAFALFASVYKLYFGIFVVAHWCIMTFWVIQGETDFCMSKWEEIIYNMVVGIIYIFCWFNVKEGRSRRRMTLYYCIVLLENAVLTGFWYSSHNFTTDFRSLILVCVVASSFALGIFFMCVYYCLLHPNGPMLAPQAPGCICPESPGPCGPPADAITSPPRSLPRTTGAERDGVSVAGERAGTPTPPVFQVRPGLPITPVARTVRTERPVIRIDLPRKKYPAWDAHFIDRRLRKTILALEYSSPITPQLQYRSIGAPQELLEYETSV
ncbi:XK-related protein 7 [Trichechus manatus latirostris]|uniref:XK-related protein n=1 Tax=Trichechus manatus latirostris TaxID=127582 RepID=A0A2Y9DAN7_TRIMA|nr:XK-related protein 7 [Trichechus manatus latirostris]